MRHLVTFVLLTAAMLAYVAGIGPLFFGTPLVGGLLVAAAIVFELVGWWRVRHKAPPG